TKISYESSHVSKTDSIPAFHGEHQKQRFLHDPMYSDTPLKKSSAFYTDVAEIASITEPLTIRCLKPTLIGSEGESSSRFKDIPEAHTLIPNETSQNYALHVCHGDKSPVSPVPK
ncbi:hypothetical protein ADUPG1_010503, partial [Aduncisulcus paluster]